MDDPNITMEEYIRLKEENLIAIVFNETLTSEAPLLYEPTVSSLNNDEINFRISFDESDVEDYTVVIEKILFSYKIIFANDLKKDLKINNDKVNMPSFPSPKPMVSYFDDLDYFKDFEKEFPAIVYNDALTFKLDLLTKPTVSPQHINEFNLKDETSLFECDEEEQNVLNFNDLFPFNVIYPNDSKSDKDNDDDKVNIKHSLRDLSPKSLLDVINTDDGAYVQSTVCMVVPTQLTLSLGMSARIAKAAALSLSLLRKRYRSSYETPSPSSSLTLPIWKRYQGISELVEDTKDEILDLDTKGEGLEDRGLVSEDEGPSLEEEEED
nr:hypothetical protein [Tanacetum cinerariifolium]